LARDGKTRRTKATRDKGHAREIELTLEALRRGDCSPIPFEELMDVSEATFAIEEAIGSGEVVSLRDTQIPAVHQTAENSDSANHALFGHAPVSNVIRNLGL
jgi:hypothetical protein